MSKQYTRSEVANNTDKESTLIILHDKVYNVYKFLNEHPGGEEILLEQKGKDGSEHFDDVGHSKDAFELMQKYEVGEIVDAEKTHTKPKKNWGSATITKPDKEQEMSPVWVVGAIIALAAIAYYLFM